MSNPSRSPRLVLAAVAVAVSAAPLAAQEEGSFRWSDEIPAGADLRVYTVHGDVRVSRASGATARVEARTRVVGSGRGEAREIRFETFREGNQITVCAFYEEGSSCGPEGIRTERSWGRNRRSTRADLTVELPAGVDIRVGSGNGDLGITGATARVRAASGNGDVSVGPGAGSVDVSTGNGDVEVQDARAPVEASSGNGRIDISTSAGPVEAATGNGPIRVRMTSLRAAEDMSFSSGNGTITLTLPSEFEGEVDASTGHGGLDSDFPVTLQGRLDRGRFRGTIGEGGPRLRITTGNGSIVLRRAGGGPE